MRILITNDDGINAPGLEVLEHIATELAGPAGEVWVVAPAFEQSGVGHCISYTHPTMIAKLGERRFAAEGSPADCVLAGLYDVLEGQRPDLVLSGVNRGNNAGENTLYSGTIGGAMEGALQGVRSIALSQFLGPDNIGLDNPFESAAIHGTAAVRWLLEHGEWEGEHYNTFYNVNFPPCSAAKTGALKITSQGRRKYTNFSVEPHIAPSGRRFLWIKGGPQHERTGAGTDVDATLENHISLTPMRADLTAHDAVERLREKLG